MYIFYLGFVQKKVRFWLENVRKRLVLNNRELAVFKASSSTLVGSRMLGIVRGVTGMVTIQYQKAGAVSGGL